MARRTKEQRPKGTAGGTRAGITLTWDGVIERQWREYLATVGRAPLEQSWSYGDAIAAGSLYRPTRGVFRRGREVVAMAQAIDWPLAGVAHIVKLVRGPLFLTDALEPMERTAIFQLLKDRWPMARLNWFFFTPEAADSAAARDRMTVLGLKRTVTGDSTAWLDLSSGMEALRAGLHQKWRNRLRHGEVLGLRCETRTDSAALDWLLPRYLADRKAKRYRGPSATMLTAMSHSFSVKNEMLILRACEGDGTIIAAIMLLLHGRAATYQIGWSNPEGRRMAATNFLLWQAIEMLKARGIDWLDLGGIHPAAAPGLTHFKSGLGGISYQTVGAYR